MGVVVTVAVPALEVALGAGAMFLTVAVAPETESTTKTPSNVGSVTFCSRIFEPSGSAGLGVVANVIVTVFPPTFCDTPEMARTCAGFDVVGVESEKSCGGKALESAITIRFVNSTI
jgi:hypothetical protein